MTIIFQLTYNCSLRCKYCYQNHELNKSLEWNDCKIFLDEFISFLQHKESKIFSPLIIDRQDWANEIEENGITFNFFGGESTLKFNLIKQIILYYQEQCKNFNLNYWYIKTSFQIDSNGTILTEEDYKWLWDNYQYQIQFSISLDGCKELHNLYRQDKNGNGSFEKTIQAIELIKKYWHYLPNNKFTWTKDSCEYIIESFKLFNELGYDRFNGSFDVIKDFSINDINYIYNKIIEGIDWVLLNSPSIKMDFLNEFYGETIKNNCGSYGTQICLGPDGLIFPCYLSTDSFLAEQSNIMCYGDVNNGITNLTLLNFLRNRVFIKPTRCNKCPIQSGCINTGCPAFFVKKTGTTFLRVTNCCQTIILAKAKKYYLDRIIELHLEDKVPDFQKIKTTANYDPDYDYLIYHLEEISDEAFAKTMNKLFSEQLKRDQ